MLIEILFLCTFRTKYYKIPQKGDIICSDFQATLIRKFFFREVISHVKHFAEKNFGEYYFCGLIYFLKSLQVGGGI